MLKATNSPAAVPWLPSRRTRPAEPGSPPLGATAFSYFSILEAPLQDLGMEVSVSS